MIELMKKMREKSDVTRDSTGREFGSKREKK